ncbi:MAG: hypothetical protein M3R58_16925 [Pseudomonadota bacterium]|nr:hypothetical protein [Pseudomonadota bacterium]
MVSDTIFWVLLVALPVHAGRPLTTEDAAILAAKHCQAEAWIDRGHAATTGWFVPACNFGLDTELQLGVARTRAEGEARFSEAYFQAKRVLREMTDPEPWSVGLVVGVTKRPLNETHRGWQNPYVLVPFTQLICNTPFTVHANVGWARDREARRDLTLWGAALEAQVGSNLTLLTEAYGQNSEKPFVRIGGRWNAITDRLDVDLTWVTRPGGSRDERFVSLGVSWQSGALLP